jgi:polar amino acid transport system substrate-binding protein
MEAAMKKFIGTVMLVFILLKPAFSSELIILTENLPPLNYVKDGKLVGPSVEIVQKILKRIGSDKKIQVFPWSRAYKMALEQKNVVLFGMTHTQDRDNKFHWVGPLATKRDVLVARKDSGIKITGLKDAKKVNRIGTLRDDTREQFLKIKGFTNLESVSDEQLNAKKLFLGRIELWAYKQPGLKTVCDLAGVDHNEFKEVYHLRRIDVSIAFSKNTSPTIVKKWRDAFDEMRLDGTIEKIHRKWNLE